MTFFFILNTVLTIQYTQGSTVFEHRSNYSYQKLSLLPRKCSHYYYVLHMYVYI